MLKDGEGNQSYASKWEGRKTRGKKANEGGGRRRRCTNRTRGAKGNAKPLAVNYSRCLDNGRLVKEGDRKRGGRMVQFEFL